MVMVGVEDSSQQADSAQVNSLTWCEGWKPLVADQHLSNELGELVQWGDSTINIISVLLFYYYIDNMVTDIW